MGELRIAGIKELVNKRFLKMYEADTVNNNESHFPYYFTSRRDQAEIVAKTGRIEPDGAVIYGIVKRNGENCLVLVHQFRIPVNMKIYEVPSGLIDAGETVEQAAVREFKEETGLDLQIYHGGNALFRRAFIQAQGICDECNAVVYGYAEGEISTAGLEASEDLEVVIANKAEVRRILSEEQVSLRGAYLMMMFLHADNEHPFSFLEV